MNGFGAEIFTCRSGGLAVNMDGEYLYLYYIIYILCVNMVLLRSAFPTDHCISTNQHACRCCRRSLISFRHATKNKSKQTTTQKTNKNKTTTKQNHHYHGQFLYIQTHTCTSTFYIYIYNHIYIYNIHIYTYPYAYTYTYTYMHIHVSVHVHVHVQVHVHVHVHTRRAGRSGGRADLAGPSAPPPPRRRRHRPPASTLIYIYIYIYILPIFFFFHESLQRRERFCPLAVKISRIRSNIDSSKRNWEIRRHAAFRVLFNASSSQFA